MTADREPQVVADGANGRVLALVLVALLAVYVATLAPGLTLWDSGEFLSAVATLGVPHPPGTPLFIVIGRAWSDAFGFLPLAVAMNLASGVATAAACALLSSLLLGWAGPRAILAGGVMGGTMSVVWQNATETEVYALALCFAAAYLIVADVAGRRASPQHRLLVAFLFGLAVPLQISALVAGPAAILLLSTGTDGRWTWRLAVGPAGAWCLAIGVGTVSVGPVVVGTILLVGVGVLTRDTVPRRTEGVVAGVLVLLGTSALLTLLFRAQHDPWVNQGNASSWAAFWDVVGRRQYDVPGLWPRRAPWWLQLGNLVQYADWQVAAGLSDAVGASWRRTPLTIAAMIAAVYGAAWHRARDPRSFRVFVVLLLSATVGVVAILNLRAGPSYGWGILPDGALREARERDYFFALAFVLWGLWSGLGVVRLAARVRAGKPRMLVLALATLPLLLNWSTVDRRRHPDAALPDALGVALLGGAPPGAVVVTAGDNDSYAMWYRQAVFGERRDVTTVVAPLLGARWYRDELRRRYGLLDSLSVASWRGEPRVLESIASLARARQRPLVATAGLSRTQRSSLATSWRSLGLVYIASSGSPGTTADTARARSLSDMLQQRGLTSGTRVARGPAGRYIQQLLLCPEAVLERATGRGRTLERLLESVCNS